MLVRLSHIHMHKMLQDGCANLQDCHKTEPSKGTWSINTVPEGGSVNIRGPDKFVP